MCKESRDGRAGASLTGGLDHKRNSRLPPLLGYWKPRHVRGFFCSRTVVRRPFATSALRGRMQPERDRARVVALLNEGASAEAKQAGPFLI